MKVTVFTSNQPRHLNLVRELAQIAGEVFCIQECKTIFPGLVEDFFKKSDVMRAYFKKVIKAERHIFDDIAFSTEKVRTLSIKSGDLNKLDKNQLGDALHSDVYIVFGASYIQGWLIDFLVSNGAFNIHMGLSPYYRGSSCNFWALYDNNPGYVGATIHKLSQGLDNGPMLFHCLPVLQGGDTPFDFTMRSVKIAHDALCSRLSDSTLFSMVAEAQDRTKEVRYSRRGEFNDEVAHEFLLRKSNIQTDVFQYPMLKEPFFG